MFFTIKSFLSTRRTLISRIKTQKSKMRLSTDGCQTKKESKTANRQIFVQTLAFCLCWLPRQESSRYYIS